MHEHEILILNALDSLSKGSPHVSEFKLETISERSSLPLDSVRKAAGLLADRHYVNVHERLGAYHTSPSAEGSRFLKDGFPEERLVKKLEEKGGHAAMSELDDEEKRVGLGWAKKNGWVELSGGELHLKEKPVLASYVQRNLLQKISTSNSVAASELDAAKLLLSRSLISEPKPEKSHSLAITKAGLDALGAGLRPSYNLTAPTSRAYPAKLHPVQRSADRIRQIFFELGFEEIRGSAVESAFWNFDALFQPQDHPARELADTFYLEGEEPLPKGEVVERVKKAHQQNWKYKWDEAFARKRVLRTHTTAVSARYLDKSMREKRESAKYFCVGRVYRNEVVDFKHLAEFYQIDGIVLWEKATFADLLGLLREFYRKLGFEKIRFRPSYFPYTEPSLEVEVYFEQKKAWLELGGAGIFRPEVCLPLWGKYPVLAWGLSLERPIMLANDVEDIRSLYRNDMGWLRDFKLKQ
ncbi:MAG: phenylalanine--tRNA ligase subunit alpha [Candidatus Burarchaeum sp.]|nr:phenylalanine--tRNA ligase subunit alpha [Candidatus Burarchaeum sp.]MDO8339164.1 phenylalanine--tRNA ligase subunit alpha [Candidatus Burarchaeum sp.]